MVKIDIQPKEINALDIIMKETKCTVVIGYLLGNLRARIQQGIEKEQEAQLRERYGKKDKNTKA